MNYPAEQPRPASRTFSGAVLGITVLNFVFFTAYLCYFPTLPFFIEKLGGRTSEIGLLIGISAFTSLAVRPFVGYLVDTVGRKPMVVAGLAMFTLNALLYNLARETTWVFPLRMITGASLSTFVTAASAYIADVAPADRRGSVMAYYGLANSFAFALAPALGGFIIHTDLVGGFDESITGQASWLSGAHTGELHFTTMFLFTAAMTAIAGVAALLLLPVTGVRVQGRRIDPRDLFARSAAFPAAVNFTSGTMSASITTFMPLFARDLGLENPGVLFMVYAAFVIIMRLGFGRLMDRLSREAFIVPGAFALAGCGFALAASTSVPMLFVAAAFYGIGAGTMTPALMAYLVDRTEPAQRGRALSTFTLGSDLGLSAGAFLLGFVVEATSYRLGFAITGVIALLGALAVVLNSFRARHQVDAALVPAPAAAAVQGQPGGGSPAS